MGVDLHAPQTQDIVTRDDVRACLAKASQGLAQVGACLRLLGIRPEEAGKTRAAGGAVPRKIGQEPRGFSLEWDRLPLRGPDPCLSQ